MGSFGWEMALGNSSFAKFSLTNAQFRTAAFMGIGVSLPQLSNIKKCINQCGKDVDQKGYRLLTCKFGGGPIRRHDHFLDSYHDMLRSADFRCKKRSRLDSKASNAVILQFTTTVMARSCCSTSP